MVTLACDVDGVGVAAGGSCVDRIAADMGVSSCDVFVRYNCQVSFYVAKNIRSDVEDLCKEGQSLNGSVEAVLGRLLPRLALLFRFQLPNGYAPPFFASFGDSLACASN